MGSKSAPGTKHYLKKQWGGDSPEAGRGQSSVPGQGTLGIDGGLNLGL